MSLNLRYTTEPDQEIFIDPFSRTTSSVLNYTSKLLLAPFFTLENEKIPNIVTPGGYRGAECFSASYSSSALTLGPGYCVMNEMLIDFKTANLLDLSDTNYYLDSGTITVVPTSSSGSSGSGSSGSSGTTPKGKLYIVVYYNPNNNLWVSGYSASGSSGSGSSGNSGLKTISVKDGNAAYLAVITNPNTYLINKDKLCFLYYVEVNLVRGKATTISSVAYRDPTVLYAKRRLPDYNF